MPFLAALLLPVSLFIGTWTGTSKCTGARAACRDEIVVYHIAEKSESTLTVTMNKIVDGNEETMGTLEMRVEGETLTGDYDGGRLKSRWTFTLKEAALTGTAKLLPGGEVIRHLSLHRSSSASRQDP